MPTRPDVTARHSQQRTATRTRILDCARSLVEDRPWSKVSIGVVTDRAGLTRTAFYKHFPDRRALLLGLFAELGEELAATPDPWQQDGGEGDPRRLLEASVAALVDTFLRHGRLLEAIAAEAAFDEEIAVLYRRLGEGLASGVAARIERDVTAGRSTVQDPLETATTLVWMNERYLRLRFGRRPLGDPERAVAVLTDVWMRAVYCPGHG